MRVATEERRTSTWLLVSLVATSLLLTTLYFREGERGPLRSLRAGVLAATSPVAGAGEVIASPLRAAGNWVSGLGVGRQQADELRRQNAALRVRVAQLEEASLENERLRKLVKFAEARSLDARGAHVIARPASAWEGAITIDVGSDDGIALGMPVLAEQGLVGQVVQVAAKVSRVRLISDQRSGVAAMVQRTRATGVVRGSVESELTFDFVDRKSAPKRGDVVLTSGLGGVYPKGLLVGEILEVEMRPSDLFPRILVASAVQVGSLEEVLVLTGAPPTVEGVSGE